MPETYKSVGTIVNTIAGVTVYTGVTFTNSTALVNSINIANGATASANSFSVELLKGGITGHYIIFGAQLPLGASIQIVDNTLVMERNDTLRFTAGFTLPAHVIVSAMEIT